MSHSTENTPVRSRKEKLLIMALVLCGLLFIGYFGGGVVRGFLLFRTNPLKPGITNVEAIRPWMTIRYIAVAYAVPQEYIFFELEIPFNQKESDDSLRRLNDKHEFGPPTSGEGPPILQKVKEAIKKYQKDPVPTGLNDIKRWMSIQYIANATGVPAAYIFESIDLPNEEDNEYMLLIDLSRKYKYDRRGERGERSERDQRGERDELVEAIKNAISQYEAQNPASLEGKNE